MKMRSLDKLQDDDQTLKLRFTEISSALVDLLCIENIKTKAYRDEGLPHFSVLSTAKKIDVIDHLEVYYNLCAEHLSEGQALRDSKRFTWRALVKMGLAPFSDLLNRITEGDIVEIYGCDNTQLFRNLEFFDVCSYSIEELFCVEWYRLFQRDNKISDLIGQKVKELLDYKHPEGLEGPFPEHIVTEIFSDEKYQSKVFMKVVAPLYQNKRIAAFICIERGHVVNN
ncbi:hypothetical protein [Bdellovibrio sp. HCB337]|uniref:hypothetical protein n=1 Tax=Bdellovibrio sp. HCB337 TaxID=3394358 RepID=UPI0039A55E95